MMKPVFRRFLTHPQRGSLGPEAAPPPPPSFRDIHHHLDQLDQRLQRLRTAVANLEQLQQADAAPSADADLVLSAEELQRLQLELDSFERELAAQLFTWEQLREPFWQAVRFGGAGVLLGWLLARLVG